MYSNNLINIFVDTFAVSLWDKCAVECVLISKSKWTVSLFFWFIMKNSLLAVFTGAKGCAHLQFSSLRICRPINSVHLSEGDWQEGRAVSN